jgi:hypothetical protein
MIQVPYAFTSVKTDLLNKAAERIKMNAAFRPVHGAADSAVRALCFSLACGCTAFDVRILAH